MIGRTTPTERILTFRVHQFNPIEIPPTWGAVTRPGAGLYVTAAVAYTDYWSDLQLLAHPGSVLSENNRR